MKKILILIIFLSLGSNIKAQRKFPSVANKILITGKVIDIETGQPLEYATILFKNPNTPKLNQGGITNQNGVFKIEIIPGKYDIITEYISFEKNIDKGIVLNSSKNIGEIKLKISVSNLDEIELIGEQTQVEIRLDKRVYNVGKDITVRGGSVSDVMNNIPSVSVDPEGNISLRGNGNVRILINGKPSGLVGLSGPQGLRQLPAESIEKVEVITSPSARYEASGTAGILNIILKKQNLEGFNGSLALNSGFPRAIGSNLNMNYRENKINLFSTISINDAKSLGGGLFDSEYFNGINPSTFTYEDRDYDRVRKRVFLNLGLEYYINDETSLTMTGFTRNSDNSSNNSTIIQDVDQNKLVLNEFGRFQDEEEDDISRQLTLNFTKKFNKKGHELVIEFQTEESTEDESDYASNTNTFDQSSMTDETQQRKLLQLDYVYPFNENTQFELGYRGNFSHLNTDYNVFDIRNNETTKNLNLSNIFVFNQNVNAYYTQFGKKINKFSYLLGLRAETTNLKFNQKTSQESNQKKYTDLFPTVNLSYEFSDSENITLGYSRRIRRPRSWSLNPFQSITSLTFFRQGNPDLDPSYSNSYDLGYLKRMKKFTFSGSVYFQKETDVIQRITEETGEIVRVSENPIVDVPALRFTSINLSENIRTGTEFTLTYTPKRTVRLSGNFNLFNSETIGNYKGDTFDASILTWFARINSSFPLPLGTNAQINGYYRGPRENAQRKTKGLVGFSGAINKQILKKKGTISFRASDIFNSQISRSTTLTDSFENYTEFQWRAPTYIFTLTYRVNENKSNRRRNSRQYNSDTQEFDFGD
ncbi:MAG: TonB-dependent receptor [Flavobacteriales bacterium]|nr:MAG: TonB-dependent receptor [Flavobacteriales bacterium]